MTRKTVKNPQVFRVRQLHQPWRLPDGAPYHSVEITLSAYRSLPDWVQALVRHNVMDDNARHCRVVVQARDELEALMRFQKLWAGLPKHDE